MRFSIAAIGRLKQGPDRALLERYCGLLNGLGRSCSLGPLQIVELPESKAQTVALRRKDESQRLLAGISSADHRILLDERGRSHSSERFAEIIAGLRDDGKREIAFLIGGADGHGAEIKSETADTLSLSQLTLPHGLARIILAEQLYRAITILAGHPYHRA